MRKKILFWIWTFWILLTTTSIWYVNADWYAPTGNERFWNTAAVWWYWVPWADRAQDNWSDELLNIIKTVINWILWLLSLLALILCLRWWFQMLTAWWDDGKVKKWFKVLKNAAIWLAVIWFSRIAVSFVFRIVDKFATPS